MLVIAVFAAIKKGRDLFGDVTAFRVLLPLVRNSSTALTLTFAMSPSPPRIAASAKGVCCTRINSTSTPSRLKYPSSTAKSIIEFGTNGGSRCVTTRRTGSACTG